MFKCFQAPFIIISEHLLQEVNQLPHALSVARRSEDFLFERTLLVQLQQHHLQEGVEQKCEKHFLSQKTDQVRWRVQNNLICYWCQLKSKLSTGIIRKCLNPQSWLFMTPIKSAPMCDFSLFPTFFKLVSSCFVTTIKCPSSVFFF